MESPSNVRAFSSAARRIMPWFVLFGIVSGAVHALELAASLPAAVAGPPAPLTDSKQPPISDVAVPTSSHEMLLTIVIRDSASGKDIPWQCVTTTDRAPMTDELIVDANGFAAVAEALCGRN
jgi:hypothetical protein